jgi:hypothetical protein
MTFQPRFERLLMVAPRTSAPAGKLDSEVSPWVAAAEPLSAAEPVAPTMAAPVSFR